MSKEKQTFTKWDKDQYTTRSHLSDWKIFEKYGNRFIVNHKPELKNIIGNKKTDFSKEDLKIKLTQEIEKCCDLTLKFNRELSEKYAM